jgi:Tol biopolymer transport system component
MRRTSGFLSRFGLVVALTVLVASPLHAQYFGRNKVQYRDFKFQVLKTEHFDVYYYPGEKGAATQAGRMAERWRARLGKLFNHDLSGRQPLILYASPAEFQQTNAIEGSLGEGTGGVTEALRRRIVLPVGGSLGDLNHVIGHELTHAYQYDITGGGRSATLGSLPAATALPLWFIEGMAEYMSLGPIDGLTAMWMRGAIADTGRDSLPSFRQLDDPTFFPYRYGQALLAYVAGHWGDQAIGELLRQAARRRGVDMAIRGVLSLSPDELVSRWHQELHATYDPLGNQTQPPEDLGPRIVGANNQGRYNIAPSLSPDGSRMMFLSDRDLFSIDLFMADARNGHILRQITKTAVDPHLQSLESIESAGTWSPDGKHFVFSAISSGLPELALYDVDNGKRVKEVKFRDLGEILNPSWSPDGRSIAFAGVSGGLTDLFVYDVESGKSRRLTNDDYADLQPAWSPDSKTIAFATDRFTTNLDSLRIGSLALGLIDVGSGKITRIAGTGTARQLNPQWAPDGANLYFLSDPNGITNIYRVNLPTGQLAQVTNLFTGVSGITATSPAFTVAQNTGRLMYSVFRSNGYELYAIDAPESHTVEQMTAYRASDSTKTAAALPPVDRSHETLVSLLQDPVHGLPSDSSFSIAPYKAGLALTYVGQPSLAVGASQFGTYIGGGASLYFSDLLGNHNLVTGLNVQGSLKDINALVGYQNLTHRLNWGVVGQQVPYTTGGFVEGTATVNGEPTLIDQELIQRQTNRDFYGVLAYPFSPVQRMEFQAGFTNISFDQELRTTGFSLITGQQTIDDKQSLAAGSAINLGSASAAWVYDNSFMGATGPILGQRFRIELSPSVGSLSYVGGLVDFRKYLMPARPFTIATRLLSYGRYGSGGEDPRLQPLFLGYPGLVRGYSYGSFSAAECHPKPSDPNGCPVYDQLLGSRMVVANAELRFPLFGALGVGPGYYGAFPIDFTVFGDGGLAWDSQNEPSIFGSGTRDPVFSAGAGLRINLLGFAVAEVDLVRPFDRPDKGWVWQFDFQQGF